MEYYRNVDIERDETIGEAQREEAEEFPEILGGTELPMPPTHAVLATVGEDDGEEEVEAGEIGEEE